MNAFKKLYPKKWKAFQEVKQIAHSVPYPTTKYELLRHARAGGTGDAHVDIVALLDDTTYRTYSDVITALEHIITKRPSKRHRQNERVR